MKNTSKYKRKFLIAILISAISLFGMSNTNFKVKANDTVDITPVETTVSTNMLNVDSALITRASVRNIVGKNQTISAKFTDLPTSNEKIFAVLVDEIAGGIIEKKFLDANNSVSFNNIREYIKLPGIHLYKQNADDTDFILRKENFIASTSYLMPYVKKYTNNGGLTDAAAAVKAYKGNEVIYEDVPDATLQSTTIEDVYSLALPSNMLPFIEGTTGLDAKDLLATVIAEDENGNAIDVRQWVSTNYNESGYLCRFEFLLPQGTKNLQIHLYKHGLYENNFLCKYSINLDKTEATDTNIK